MTYVVSSLFIPFLAATLHLNNRVKWTAQFRNRWSTNAALIALFVGVGVQDHQRCNFERPGFESYLSPTCRFLSARELRVLSRVVPLAASTSKAAIRRLHDSADQGRVHVVASSTVNV